MKYWIGIIHVMIWVGGLTFTNWPSLNLTVGYFNVKEGTMLLPTLWGTALNAIIFYGNADWLMPQWLEQNKVGYFVRLLSLFLLVCGLEILFDYYYAHQYLPELSVLDSELIGLASSFNFVFLLFSFGYGFAKISVRQQARQRLLASEKLQSELNFLKHQINPHFLFNTLNNLFALSRKNGDLETSGQLAKLANLMRYMLYETNSAFVPLSREIEYLRNYIALQKLRFSTSDSVFIQENWGEETQGYPIAPFLLLPLVENAFKYGISLQEHSFININLEVADGKLTFRVENSWHLHKANKTVGGVGLDNLTKRLCLLYPNSHRFIIQPNQSEKVFTATLELQK